MASDVALPPGFALDNAPAPTDIQGFQFDRPQDFSVDNAWQDTDVGRAAGLADVLPAWHQNIFQARRPDPLQQCRAENAAEGRQRPAHRRQRRAQNAAGQSSPSDIFAACRCIGCSKAAPVAAPRTTCPGRERPARPSNCAPRAVAANGTKEATPPATPPTLLRKHIGVRCS